MAMVDWPRVRTSDGPKRIGRIHTWDGGEWKEVAEGYVYSEGEWRRFFKNSLKVESSGGTFLNMREVLEDQLPAGEGGVFEGVKVELELTDDVLSDDSSTPAIETGDWPSGVELRLIIPEGVTVRGGGGDGGDNPQPQVTYKPNDYTCLAGGDGKDGGPAIKATVPLTVENRGRLEGGEGGYGGGGAAYHILRMEAEYECITHASGPKDTASSETLHSYTNIQILCAGGGGKAGPGGEDGQPGTATKLEESPDDTDVGHIKDGEGTAPGEVEFSATHTKGGSGAGEEAFARYDLDALFDGWWDSICKEMTGKSYEDTIDDSGCDDTGEIKGRGLWANRTRTSEAGAKGDRGPAVEGSDNVTIEGSGEVIGSSD